jgi:CIC family chloride channel protein
MVFPEAASGQGLYAIVGMGAVSAAVLGAPMSTTLIIFEMTGDYKVTIAVMLAAAVASILTQRVMARSFFLWQLERHGVSLAGGRERQLLQSSTVKDVMVDAYNLVHRDDSLRTLRELLQTKPYGDFFVVDDEERLAGTITFADLRPVAFEPEVDELINALDLAKTDLHVLEVDSNLEEALKVMEEQSLTRMPVVDKLKTMHVVGVARYRDVLRAYTRALLQARAEDRGER